MSDAALEAAIDRAGRDRVLATARAAGWTNEAPPKWVWWIIIAEIDAGLEAEAAKKKGGKR
jgi:hypothetical protein